MGEFAGPEKPAPREIAAARKKIDKDSELGRSMLRRRRSSQSTGWNVNGFYLNASLVFLLPPITTGAAPPRRLMAVACALAWPRRAVNLISVALLIPIAFNARLA